MTPQEAMKIIGLSNLTTIDDMNRAYRKKAVELHPDRNKHPDANRQMVQLNVAKDRLVDFFNKGEKLGDQSSGTRSPWGDWYDPRQQSEREWRAYEEKRRREREEARKREADAYAARQRAQQQRAREQQARARSYGGDQHKVGDVVINRKFQFNDPYKGQKGSHKFWSIGVFKLNENEWQATIQHGRIGSKGVVHNYKFSSLPSARRFAEDMIFSKMKKGYQEVTANPFNQASGQTKQASQRQQPGQQQTKQTSTGPEKQRTVYGRHGRFSVHTRVGGQVFGNPKWSVFRRGEKVVTSKSGKNLNVKHPDSQSWTQTWEPEDDK